MFDQKTDNDIFSNVCLIVKDFERTLVTGDEILLMNDVVIKKGNIYSFEMKDGCMNIFGKNYHLKLFKNGKYELDRSYCLEDEEQKILKKIQETLKK